MNRSAVAVCLSAVVVVSVLAVPVTAAPPPVRGSSVPTASPTVAAEPAPDRGGAVTVSPAVAEAWGRLGGGPPASIAAGSGKKFRVVDAYSNQQGKLVVSVRATTTEYVTSFNVWYNDTGGGSEVGPLSLSGGGITSAVLDDGTAYDSSTGINKDSGNNGIVRFTLDSAQAPPATTPVELNVTSGGNTDWSATPSSERSTLTTRYRALSATTHDGNALGGMPTMVYNASNDTFLGFSFTGGTGTFVQHCQGRIAGTECTPVDGVPDTVVTRGHTKSSGPGGTSYSGVTPVGDVEATVMDLANGNDTGRVTLTRGETVSASATEPSAPTFWSVLQVSGSPPTVDELRVVNDSSGAEVFRWNRSLSSGVGMQPPPFLSPTTNYRFEFDLATGNGGNTTVSKYYTTPTSGMSDIRFNLTRGSVETSAVTGKVVDENGNAVADAVVFAEQNGAASMQGSTAFNTTTTGANGGFTMHLPESAALGVRYRFRVVSNQTTAGGTPKYYPTTDGNDGEGYEVRESKTVLPPITLQEGGRVNVNVKPDTGSKLPVGAGYTELSQTSNASGHVERTALSAAFGTYALGGGKPASASVSLMAPTTGKNSSVWYTTWGFGQGISHVCTENVAVSTGSDVESTCSLENAGTLRVDLTHYRDIVSPGMGTTEPIDGFRFFFENALLVRDGTTGEVVTYYGPKGLQPFFAGGGPDSVDVPLPPGDYTVELRPVREFVDRTTVRDTTSYTVSADTTTTVSLDRGSAFRIEPSPDRFERSLARGSDNTLAVAVRKPSGKALSGSELSVEARLAHPNGTVASDPVSLSYNASDTPTPTFDTESFKPSTLGVEAGVYDLVVTASHESGSRTYNTTRRFRVQVTDFSMSLALSSQAVGTGDSVTVTMRAFDTTTSPPTGIDASDVRVSVYDETGSRVSRQSGAGVSISSGSGSVSLSAPDEPGFYRVSAFADTGTDQSVAERWIRVSDLDVSVATNRSAYGPDDRVNLTVEVEDASSGTAAAGASVEARLNGETEGGTTDADGELTLTLEPTEMAKAQGSWGGDRFVDVAVVYEGSNGQLTRQTAGVGFRVRAVEANVEPRSSAFTSDENVVLDVRVPSDAGVSSVTASDGTTTHSGTKRANGYWTVDLGNQPVGAGTATVNVTAGGDSETVETGFRVQSYQLRAEPSAFRYGVNDAVEVNVSLRTLGGSAVADTDVSARLLVPADSDSGSASTFDTASATTDANGRATLSLSPQTAGFHLVELSAGEQNRTVGVLVTDVNVTLRDGQGGDVVERVRLRPGKTESVDVRVETSDGSAVPDGTDVTAAVRAFERTFVLGTAQTSGGDATITGSVPASVSAGQYGLVVSATTPGGGEGSTFGTAELSGGEALELSVTANRSRYAPGETASFSATLTYANGTAVDGRDVEFALLSDGAAEQSLGSDATGAGGTAAVTYDVPHTGADGEYVVRASLADQSAVKSYTGFRQHGLSVAVSTNASSYVAGDHVRLTVDVNNSTTGAAVTATGGVVRVAEPGGGERTVELSPSGGGPYEVDVKLPDDADTGSYALTVLARAGGARGVASTVADVRNESESVSLSVPSSVTAGSETTVTATGTVDTTGTLTVYSPGTSRVTYENDSVPIADGADTDVSLTVNSSGVYVFKLSAPTVGTVTEVVQVAPAADSTPVVYTGPDLGSNATTVTRTETVYVKSNTANATAHIVGNGTETTLSLNQEQNGVYYATYTAKRASGTYLVRLDTANATGVADDIFTVEASS